MRGLLLSAKTTVCKEIASCPVYPRESASCRESRHEAESRGQTLGRKQNHADRISRKIFIVYSRFGRKPVIADISAEARYDGQSLQEAKISGQVHTLWARASQTIRNRTNNNRHKLINVQE